MNLTSRILSYSRRPADGPFREFRFRTDCGRTIRIHAKSYSEAVETFRRTQLKAA